MITSQARSLMCSVGKWLIALGLGGFVFTYVFDIITKGIFLPMGWIQKVGLLVFAVITFCGYFINIALENALKAIDDADKLIGEYLELIDSYEQKMGKI